MPMRVSAGRSLRRDGSGALWRSRHRTPLTVEDMLAAGSRQRRFLRFSPRRR